jgi:hypothetical protein
MNSGCGWNLSRKAGLCSYHRDIFSRGPLSWPFSAVQQGREAKAGLQAENQFLLKNPVCIVCSSQFPQIKEI